jgi:hypothetical protein
MKVEDARAAIAQLGHLVPFLRVFLAEVPEALAPLASALGADRLTLDDHRLSDYWLELPDQGLPVVTSWLVKSGLEFRNDSALPDVYLVKWAWRNLHEFTGSHLSAREFRPRDLLPKAVRLELEKRDEFGENPNARFPDPIQADPHETWEEWYARARRYRTQVLVAHASRQFVEDPRATRVDHHNLWAVWYQCLGMYAGDVGEAWRQRYGADPSRLPETALDPADLPPKAMELLERGGPSGPAVSFAVRRTLELCGLVQRPGSRGKQAARKL